MSCSFGDSLLRGRGCRLFEDDEGSHGAEGQVHPFLLRGQWPTRMERVERGR